MDAGDIFALMKVMSWMRATRFDAGTDNPPLDAVFFFFMKVLNVTREKLQTWLFSSKFVHDMYPFFIYKCKI